MDWIGVVEYVFLELIDEEVQISIEDAVEIKNRSIVLLFAALHPLLICIAVAKAYVNSEFTIGVRWLLSASFIQAAKFRTRSTNHDYVGASALSNPSPTCLWRTAQPPSQMLRIVAACVYVPSVSTGTAYECTHCKWEHRLYDSTSIQSRDFTGSQLG